MYYGVDDELVSDQNKQATKASDITMLCLSEQHKLSFNEEDIRTTQRQIQQPVIGQNNKNTTPYV